MSLRRAARAALQAGALALVLGAPLAAQEQPAQASEPAAEPAADAATPINAHCPVMTDEDALPEHTIQWQGHTIGFCCNKCPRRFLDHPERYLANLPELALPATQPSTTAGAPAPAADADAQRAAEREAEAAGLLGRVHPLLVHFPIALLLAGALAEILGALRGRTGSSPAARFCVGLGALGAAAAALTGWMRAEHFAALPGTEGNVDLHRWFAVSTTGLALLLALVGLLSRERSSNVRAPGLGVFRWGLLLAAVLVAVTAHFGGTLVYGADFPFGD